MAHATDKLNLYNGTEASELIVGPNDPSAGAGVAANEGSLYHRNVVGAGELYLKIGALDTDWQEIVLVPNGVQGDILQHDGTNWVVLNTSATAADQLRVNAGGTALEYFTPVIIPPGVAAGDMLYWDGANWVILTPVAGQLLKQVAAGTAPEYLVAVQGDVFFHDGTEVAVLNAGTDGYVLTTHGAGADPTWEPAGVEEGTITIAAGAQTGAVAFGTAMSAATYGVQLSQLMTGGTGDTLYSMGFYNKAVGGFTVELSAPVLPGETVTIEWMVNRV